MPIYAVVTARLPRRLPEIIGRKEASVSAEAAHEDGDSGKSTAGGFQEGSLGLSPKALRCYPHPLNSI